MLLRVARRAQEGAAPQALAAAFATPFLFQLPVRLVVLGVMVIGFYLPIAFVSTGHGTAREEPPTLPDALLAAFAALCLFGLRLGPVWTLGIIELAGLVVRPTLG